MAVFNNLENCLSQQGVLFIHLREGQISNMNGSWSYYALGMSSTDYALGIPVTDIGSHHIRQLLEFDQNVVLCELRLNRNLWEH